MAAATLNRFVTSARPWLHKRWLPAAILAGLALPAALAVAQVQRVPELAPVDLTYFGLVMNRARVSPPWPTVRFGSWRLWDAYVNWTNLEPAPGRWEFAGLDKMVGEAQDHGVNVLVPLAMPPRWASARPDEKGAYGPGSSAEPARMEDWRNYVRTVATRFKGRVAEYQVWNEPSDKAFFTGGVDKLVAMTCEVYRILKAIDPAIRVVSGGSAGGVGHVRYLDQFLQSGGAACIDVVAHHFYGFRLAPEAVVPIIREVREVMRKNGVGHLPLWNTETGYWVQNTDGEPPPIEVSSSGWRKLDADREFGAVMQRAFLLWRAEGLDRVYWYQWIDSVFGIADAAGRPKPAAAHWDRAVDLMLGQRVGPCIAAPPNFSCQLTPARGAGQAVAWRDPLALVSREGPAPLPLDEAAVPAKVPVAAPADRASGTGRR